jgi:hypothetical protein
MMYETKATRRFEGHTMPVWEITKHLHQLIWRIRLGKAAFSNALIAD